MSREKIVDILKTIEDPEVKVDIFTMGLIYNIDIMNENHVKILMTYTTPTCPFGGIMEKQIIDKLRGIGYNIVEIELTFNPPWKPSVELRNILGV